jgi:VanZ family protein
MLWWVMTLAWAALIFFLSTRTFSPGFSEGLLCWMLHLLRLQVSSGTFHILHALLRKLAHLTEYAIFALLLYGVPYKKRQGLWQPRRAVICIAIATAYSLTDEFHQLFVPGRHASLNDCGLDTIGATLAMLVPYSRLLKSKMSSPPVPTL